MTIGILLSLLAAVLFALGNIFEKRAVDNMPSFSLRHLGGALSQVRSSPRWVVGAIASVIGSLVQIFAYHFVSISIVQSVSVAGVVFVVIASRVHFHETLRALELTGLVICVFSLSMTMLSLQGGGTAPGERAGTLSVLLVSIGTFFVVGIMFVRSRLQAKYGDLVFGVSAGLMYGLVALSNKGLATLQSQNDRTGVLQAVLSTPYLYLMVSAWTLALVLFQIGLQRGRVGVIVPVAGALSAIYVSVVGTPLFGESLPRGAIDLSMRIVGFAGIVVGSVLLTAGRENEAAIQKL